MMDEQMPDPNQVSPAPVRAEGKASISRLTTPPSGLVVPGR